MPVFGLPLSYDGHPSGHIAQLPSGSYRVEVNLGTDPITRRRIRLRETCKDLVAAQITLGKLLAQAQAGKEPESGATVGQLLDLYLPLAEWDVSTREGFEGYVRRTIRPGLGHLNSMDFPRVKARQTRAGPGEFT
jgi:integrase